MKTIFLITLITLVSCGKKTTTTKTACIGTWHGNTCVTTKTITRGDNTKEITPAYCDRYMKEANNMYYNCLDGFSSAEQR